jgi:uncharacterized protein
MKSRQQIDRFPSGRPRLIGSEKAHVIELLVFLLLIVPSMALSLFPVQQGNASFSFVAKATILRDLARVALITFFVWRNNEPVSRAGWTLRNAKTDAVLACALFIPISIGTAILQQSLQKAGFSGPSKPLGETPAGLSELALALLLVTVVAVAEEMIFRGYIILRLRSVTGTFPAVALSAIIFSIGHGYEGAAGVITVGVFGFVLAWIYMWRQSLVAPVVLHFIQDFVSVIIVPLLVHKH